MTNVVRYPSDASAILGARLFAGHAPMPLPVVGVVDLATRDTRQENLKVFGVPSVAVPTGASEITVASDRSVPPVTPSAPKIMISVSGRFGLPNTQALQLLPSHASPGDRQ